MTTRGTENASESESQAKAFSMIALPDR